MCCCVVVVVLVNPSCFLCDHIPLKLFVTVSDVAKSETSSSKQKPFHGVRGMG